jgi:hypothetical protein
MDGREGNWNGDLLGAGCESFMGKDDRPGSVCHVGGSRGRKRSPIRLSGRQNLQMR